MQLLPLRLLAGAIGSILALQVVTNDQTCSKTKVKHHLRYLEADCHIKFVCSKKKEKTHGNAAIPLFKELYSTGLSNGLG